MADKRARLTETQIERLIELGELGWTAKAIAQDIDAGVGAVTWALLREGVDRHADRPLKPVPTEPTGYVRNGHAVRRYTEADDAELLRLELQGLKTYQIARAMGRQFNSVIGRMRTLARRQAREEVQSQQQEAA